MPTSPRHFCARSGCRDETSERYCTKHQYADRTGRDPVKAMYKTSRWQRTRRVVLAREPLCCVCGCHAATIADHFPTSARELVAQGLINEFYRPERSRGICASCHSKKTNTYEGGFGNEPTQ